MTDSSSSTPMVLTPESTGSGSPASPSISSAVKKSRRQTAFYPNMNSSNKPVNPFSRSAAKRESVMMLGSIEHLQHYFTKAGIAAKQSNVKNYKGLVPALGGSSALLHIDNPLSNVPEIELPPSPSAPTFQPPPFPPVVRAYEVDPESLLPGVIEDLEDISSAWHISGTPQGGETNGPSGSIHDSDLLTVNGTSRAKAKRNFEVLSVMKISIRAIRSVRNYVLSLPDESDYEAAMAGAGVREEFRARNLPSSAPLVKRAPIRSISGTGEPSQIDPLSKIRRSALGVLTVLRELEETARIPLSDDAYDAQSDRDESNSGSISRRQSLNPSPNPDAEDQGGTNNHAADSSVSFSLVNVQGRFQSVPVWEDDSADFDMSGEDERDKHEPWEERLVLGSGWLYRQDIKLEDLAHQKEIISGYLDIVDSALFGGEKEGKRGWERERERLIRKEKADREGRSKGRRVSTGGASDRSLSPAATDEAGTSSRRVSGSMIDFMKNLTVSEVTEEPEEMEHISEGEESIDDEDLPDWAKRSFSVDDQLARTYAILHVFLPESLRGILPPASNRNRFLLALSSGQLLCVAYNACVRKSRRPWGYVSKDSIHDILALELAAAEAESRGEKEVKRGWTFRRTDNLRLWAGALKIRYLLPIMSSTSKAPTLKTIPPSPTQTAFSKRTEQPLLFDASLVAKREVGWEDMLEGLLLRWIAMIVEEKRGDL